MRVDGRLSAELREERQDECGVFGVWAPGEDVSHLAYFGLYALQHRGTQAAGIATSNGKQILVYKDMGLVSQVFSEDSLGALRGHLAVAHVRYATQGASTWRNAQPTLGPAAGGTLAVSHNGNLINARALMSELAAVTHADLSDSLGCGSSTDTAVITALLGASQANTVWEAALETLPRLRGAFSLVFADEQRLYAARDPFGFRPLVLGELDGGYALASESAALDIIGAKLLREIEPGELISIGEEGITSTHFAPATPRGCVFEYVYLSRPDTSIAGQPVGAARTEMGRVLAREHPADADLVIATPDSGTPAAIGYAQASGIPFAQGLVKNAYVGRTFIQPTQRMRQLGIRLKLNPLREVISGQRIVVVDDSIVRGNTQRALVAMLRDAGAAEVHVRISSPPVLWPCYFGIDFASREELIAAQETVEEICASIGADSLGFISTEGMLDATGIAEKRLCTACFTGDYPLPVNHDRAAAGGDPLEDSCR